MYTIVVYIGNMSKSSRYTTSDTALAAFLAVSGVSLVKLDTSVNPAVYTFESNGTLEGLVTQWESEVSLCRQYYNTYRSFIRQIKEKNGWYYVK